MRHEDDSHPKTITGLRSESRFLSCLSLGHKLLTSAKEQIVPRCKMVQWAVILKVIYFRALLKNFSLCYERIALIRLTFLLMLSKG